MRTDLIADTPWYYEGDQRHYSWIDWEIADERTAFTPRAKKRGCGRKASIQRPSSIKHPPRYK